MVDRSDPSAAVWAPPIGAAAPRDLCTDCGISRSSDPKQCGKACQFIKPDYPAMEARVHGRARDSGRADEVFFGPFRRMVRASLSPPREGAQWTGIATRIGERLLETGAVDAVLTMAPDPDDKWKPVPVLVTSAEGMAQCRGMRMGYAPLLALLEPARARGFKRIAVIGIPCQVYALRALEDKLGFEKIYVVGTPCSDNTTTENFHTFLDLLSDQPDTITYLEFRADYHVELRFSDGRVKEIPFLQLPISKLPPDFFPMTCRTCVDYTNVLADITVGYMGGQGEQWLLVRNARGEELLGAARQRSPDQRARERRQARRSGQGISEERRTRRRRASVAKHAELAAADRRLADAEDRSAWPRIRPRPRRDEGGRNRIASAPPISTARQEHGARACLGAGQALRNSAWPWRTVSTLLGWTKSDRKPRWLPIQIVKRNRVSV